MSKALILISKFTLVFIFLELNLFGLFPFKVNPKTLRSQKSQLHVFYCAFSGVVSFALYYWIALELLADPGLAYLTEGVAFYTIILRNICSFSIFVIFYSYQLIKRDELMVTLRYLNASLGTFGLFYSGGKLDLDVLDRNDPEVLREITHVYKPAFLKGIVCHLVVIVLKLLMAYFLKLSSPSTSLWMLALYLAYPYTLQSATSSYMLIGIRKTSFLYVAMHRKLQSMNEEVQKLVKATEQELSHFAKMTRFCELSDQVDSLASSFDLITNIGMKLVETYHVHMLIILGYTVTNNLTLFYQQYMGVTRGSMDPRLLITDMAFIFCSLFEILLIINSVGEAEMLSRKVLREVHLINYWQQKFDSRLRQSVS